MSRIDFKTTISIEGEQDVHISPSHINDSCIEIHYTEAGEVPKGEALLLNEFEMNLFIKKMQEMMEYVTKK